MAFGKSFLYPDGTDTNEFRRMWTVCILHIWLLYNNYNTLCSCVKCSVLSYRSGTCLKTINFNEQGLMVGSHFKHIPTHIAHRTSDDCGHRSRSRNLHMCNLNNIPNNFTKHEQVQLNGTWSGMADALMCWSVCATFRFSILCDTKCMPCDSAQNCI